MADGGEDRLLCSEEQPLTGGQTKPDVRPDAVGPERTPIRDSLPMPRSGGDARAPEPPNPCVQAKPAGDASGDAAAPTQPTGSADGPSALPPAGMMMFPGHPGFPSPMSWPGMPPMPTDSADPKQQAGFSAAVVAASAHQFMQMAAAAAAAGPGNEQQAAWFNQLAASFPYPAPYMPPGGQPAAKAADKTARGGKVAPAKPAKASPGGAGGGSTTPSDSHGKKGGSWKGGGGSSSRDDDPQQMGGHASVPGPQFRRCPVCKVRKNGKCGTVLASPKCFRRVGTWAPRASTPYAWPGVEGLPSPTAAPSPRPMSAPKGKAASRAEGDGPEGDAEEHAAALLDLGSPRKPMGGQWEDDAPSPRPRKFSDGAPPALAQVPRSTRSGRRVGRGGTPADAEAGVKREGFTPTSRPPALPITGRRTKTPRAGGAAGGAKDDAASALADLAAAIEMAEGSEDEAEDAATEGPGSDAAASSDGEGGAQQMETEDAAAAPREGRRGGGASPTRPFSAGSAGGPEPSGEPSHKTHKAFLRVVGNRESAKRSRERKLERMRRLEEAVGQVRAVLHKEAGRIPQDILDSIIGLLPQDVPPAGVGGGVASVDGASEDGECAEGMEVDGERGGRQESGCAAGEGVGADADAGGSGGGGTGEEPGERAEEEDGDGEEPRPKSDLQGRRGARALALERRSLNEIAAATDGRSLIKPVTMPLGGRGAMGIGPASPVATRSRGGAREGVRPGGGGSSSDGKESDGKSADESDTTGVCPVSTDCVDAPGNERAPPMESPRKRKLAVDLGGGAVDSGLTSPLKRPAGNAATAAAAAVAVMAAAAGKAAMPRRHKGKSTAASVSRSGSEGSVGGPGHAPPTPAGQAKHIDGHNDPPSPPCEEDAIVEAAKAQGASVPA